MGLLSTLRLILTTGRGTIKGLSDDEAGHDPIALFERWLSEAQRAGLYLPDAVALATSTKDGVPSVRMMLHKGIDERGFRFFTNYGSEKAAELAENSEAALAFHWNRLHRQVRVKGTVERLTAEESEAYFSTRPRGSQLGAWASQQSDVLDSRQQLVDSYKEHEERFADQEVPLPPFWGGYRLVPRRIEFWQGRANRLHDRLRYTKEADGWTRVRLYP